MSFLATGFTQMAVGLECSSGYAACWLDNNANGVDTKISCGGIYGTICGDVCPIGYYSIHCAKIDRCLRAEGLLKELVLIAAQLVLNRSVWNPAV